MCEQWFLYLFTSVLVIGSFMFGYNTGVIGGAMLLIDSLAFPLTDTQKNLLASMTIVGAIVGALLSGLITKRLGRRRLVKLSALFTIAGAILCAVTKGVTLLVVGRSLAGVGLGIASFVVPIYLSEMSPKELRGKLVSYSVVMIALGQFFGYLANVILESENGWRWSFSVPAYVSFLQFFLMFFMPDSVISYFQRSRGVKGEEALRKIRPSGIPEEEIVKELKEMKSRFSKEHNDSDEGILDLFGKYRPMLIVSVVLLFYQQFSGFNAVMYFAPTLLQGDSVTLRQSIIYGMFITICNVVFSTISLFLVEPLGRRKLLFISLAGSCIGMTIACIAFLIKMSRIVAFIGLIIFAASYAIGLGGVPWVVIYDILPSTVGGIGGSIATASNWIFNLVVSLTFFPIKNAIGEGYLVMIYAIICFSGLVFVFLFVPETKGVKVGECKDKFPKGVWCWGLYRSKETKPEREGDKDEKFHVLETGQIPPSDSSTAIDANDVVFKQNK